MEELDERRKTILKKLFHEVAFMSITLEETRQIIIRDGIIDEYQNGANQSGLKKSSAVEVYDKMLNTYLKTIAEINKNLNTDSKITPGDDILQFINKK